MIGQFGYGPQGQPQVPRRIHYQRAMSSGILRFIFSTPWLIAYFIIFNEVDPQVCKGSVYQYAKFARWAYLGSSIAIIVLFPLNLKAAKQRDDGEKTFIMTEQMILGFLHRCFNLGVWIYACIALVSRDNCPVDSLTTLIWVNVLFSGVLYGAIFCCLCCILFTAGTAAGPTRNSENQQRATENPNPATEANQLQKGLDEERKEPEMKYPENLYVYQQEMQ